METRDVGVGDPGRRNRRLVRHRVDEVGIEVAQDVVAAPSQLASDRDRCQLAVVTVLHRVAVVGVVGAAPWDAFIAASNSAQRSVGGPCRVRWPWARWRSEASTETSRPLWRTTCSERAKRRQSPSYDTATAINPPMP